MTRREVQQRGAIVCEGCGAEFPLGRDTLNYTLVRANATGDWVIVADAVNIRAYCNDCFMDPDLDTVFDDLEELGIKPSELPHWAGIHFDCPSGCWGMCLDFEDRDHPESCAELLHQYVWQLVLALAPGTWFERNDHFDYDIFVRTKEHLPARPAPPEGLIIVDDETWPWATPS